MKLMKKGKLFGILNALDILIILCILLIIIPTLHYYIKFNEKGFADQILLERYLRQRQRIEAVPRNRRYAFMEVDACFKDLTKENLEKIKLYDKEILPDGTVLAEITWLGKPEPNYYYTDNLRSGATDYLRFMLNDSRFALPAKMKIKGYLENDTFFYRAQPANNLCRFHFLTKDYAADFMIEMYPFRK